MCSQKVDLRHNKIWGINMIRIAICDNEPAILKMMNEYLVRFHLKYELELQIKTFTEGKKLLAHEKEYDIIFLDINLTEENGIEIGRKIRETDKRVKLIFLSAHDGYMKDAFQIHAFHYILKPVSEDEIHKVLLEAITYDDLCKDCELCFRTKNGLVNINVDNILFFEYQNRKVLLHSSTDGILELPGEKISCIAEKMRPYYFEVSHKSFVVNLCQVESIKSYIVHMKYGKTIPLSQLYSKQFRKRMHEYHNTRI